MKIIISTFAAFSFLQWLTSSSSSSSSVEAKRLSSSSSFVKGDNTNKRSKNSNDPYQRRLERETARQLYLETNTCFSNDDHICDWDDKGNPLFAVCTLAGETLCVPAGQAVLLNIEHKGINKGDDDYIVSSCGCCPSGENEPPEYCANLPLDMPCCDHVQYGCDNDGESVTFCYYDHSNSQVRMECGNQFTDPKYDEGDTFEGCGFGCEFPSPPPTSGPTSGPTIGPTAGPTIGPTPGPTVGPTIGPTDGPTPGSTPRSTPGPTDSCLACEGGDPTYYINGMKLRWEEHFYLAKISGCELASIKSSAEHTAAQAARTPFQNIGPTFLDFFDPIWIGAYGSNYDVSGVAQTWTWSDGSGTFNPNTLLASFTTVNIEGSSQLYLAYRGSDAFNPTEIIDAGSGMTLPALYKCCATTPANTDTFAGCSAATAPPTTPPIPVGEITRSGYCVRRTVRRSLYDYSNQDEIMDVISELKGDPFTLGQYEKETVLTLDQCQSLIDYVNDAHKKALAEPNVVVQEENDPNLDNFVTKITPQQVIDAIGLQAATDMMKFYFDSVGYYIPITDMFIRRSYAKEEDGHVNYHVDYWNMIVSLNGDNDYEGGHLVYMDQNGPYHMPRTPGKAIVNNPGDVHGIAPHNGIRYTFFLWAAKQDDDETKSILDGTPIELALQSKYHYSRSRPTTQ